ncbi:hypothetical protein HW450_06515 [Corynebacterium hindlerae]|uniref:Uncharacterized protein n=1 Tax=Corynebacterium hindlerae TaxID=699041 RepID=A0A7G5FIA3_9CORY|nr:hypothetical protein [Corynebacterium hindlerae]QMV86344.1 hypothetical protein HW450_06515 [Corynebacterium hindlerae]
MTTTDQKLIRRQALQVLTEMLDKYADGGAYEPVTEFFCNYVIVNSDEPHVQSMWQEFYEAWDLGSRYA